MELERDAAAGTLLRSSAQGGRCRPPGRRPQDSPPPLARRSPALPTPPPSDISLARSSRGRLWLSVHAARVARSWPDEIRAIYPHQSAVPREVWHHLFESASQTIDILAYSSLFLVEDVGLLDVLARKASTKMQVRIALSDPDIPHVAEPGGEGDTGEAMTAKIRNALSVYMSLLPARNVEIRLHRTRPYNSLYRADGDMLVSQHAYGLAAARTSVIHLKDGSQGMFKAYRDSFERIWMMAVLL
jgi:hypothetical protein